MSTAALERRGEATAWVGVVLALAGVAMLFCALLFAYGYLRLRAESWPPPGLPPLPRVLPTFNLAVVVASSVLLHQAGRRDGAQGRRWLLGGLALGVAFVAVQVLLWATLSQSGFTPSATGAYGAVFYGLTGIHAAHVLVGLFGLAALGLDALRGRPGGLRLRLWTAYWDFVGAVWAVLVLAVFWL